VGTSTGAIRLQQHAAAGPKQAPVDITSSKSSVSQKKIKKRTKIKHLENKKVFFFSY
jgi:hypothetical protein